MIEKDGMEMMSYNKKRSRIRFRVRGNDLPGAILIIEELVARAHKIASESRPSSQGAEFEWDEVSFLTRIERQEGPELRNAAKEILKWCQQDAYTIRWGRSREGGDGSFIPRFYAGDKIISPFAVRTGNGPGKAKVQMRFGEMKNIPPYDSVDARVEVMARLNELSGVQLDERKIDKYPKIPLAAFQSGSVLQSFSTIILQVVEDVRKTIS